MTFALRPHKPCATRAQSRPSRSGGPVRVSASVFWSLHRKGTRCDDPTVVDLSGEFFWYFLSFFSLFSAALLPRIFFLSDQISAREIVSAGVKQVWTEKGAGFGAGASDRSHPLIFFFLTLARSASRVFLFSPPLNFFKFHMGNR